MATPPPTTPQQLLTAINKQMGGSALKLGSDPLFQTRYLPTGVLPFDVLLQGGLPRNRFVILEGDYSTLKSYVGLKSIAATQASGGIAALTDTEHAFDPVWAESLGVDVAKLIYVHTETGEEAIDAAELLIRNQVDLIVFDSVAATLPQQEASKRLHEQNIQPGRQAALMSAGLRRLTAANSHTSYLWINQLRENIGMTFGPTEKAPGGRALPYYASFIVNIKKVGKITEDIKKWDGDKQASTKRVIGQKFRASLSKSKLSKPFEESWFSWDLTTGEIDELGYLIALGLDQGVIDVKGSTWSFGSARAVGKAKFRAVMVEHQDALATAVLPPDVIRNGQPAPRRKKVVKKRSQS